MSACIIPVAPDFQDPVAAQNFPPYAISVDPLAGSVITVPLEGATFDVKMLDPNVGDTMYARWIADFPPVSAQTQKLQEDSSQPPASGHQNTKEFVYTLQCGTNIPIDVITSPQQLQLVVADGAFLSDPTRPDAVATGVFRARFNWTFVMKCPAMTATGASP